LCSGPEYSPIKKLKKEKRKGEKNKVEEEGKQN